MLYTTNHHSTTTIKEKQTAKEYLIKQVLPYFVADEESKKLIDDAL